MLTMFPTNRIRELRKRAGLSQGELARMAGISQPAISQVENDTRPLTVDWMRTFTRIFGCTPADLLSDADNPDRLTDFERAIIDNVRRADPAQQQLVARVAEPVQSYQAEPDWRRDAA